MSAMSLAFLHSLISYACPNRTFMELKLTTRYTIGIANFYQFSRVDDTKEK